MIKIYVFNSFEMSIYNELGFGTTIDDGTPKYMLDGKQKLLLFSSFNSFFLK